MEEQGIILLGGGGMQGSRRVILGEEVQQKME